MGIYNLPIRVEAIMFGMVNEVPNDWGEAARDRYVKLLLRGMQDVTDDPDRAGCKMYPDIDVTARFYHLRHSRNNVVPASDRVGRPRHILVYEVAGQDEVNILGLLPDMIPLDIAVPRFVPDR